MKQLFQACYPDIHGLNLKNDEVLIFLQASNIRFDVIELSEMWKIHDSLNFNTNKHDLYCNESAIYRTDRCGVTRHTSVGVVFEATRYIINYITTGNTKSILFVAA